MILSARRMHRRPTLGLDRRWCWRIALQFAPREKRVSVALTELRSAFQVSRSAEAAVLPDGDLSECRFAAQTGYFLKMLLLQASIFDARTHDCHRAFVHPLRSQRFSQN
jgi:hypothetical protein